MFQSRPRKSSGRESSHKTEKKERKKQQLKVTFENLISVLGTDEFSTIAGASMKPFLESLYYYAAGDRTRPISLPYPVGTRDPSRFRLFPEGLVIDTANAKESSSIMESRYGKLNRPDDDAVSTILSLGRFADDDEEDALSPLPTRQSTSRPLTRATTMPVRPSGSAHVPQHTSFRQQQEPLYAPSAYEQQPAYAPRRESHFQDFPIGGSRLSTPAVPPYQPRPERVLRTNAQEGNRGFFVDDD